MNKKLFKQLANIHEAVVSGNAQLALTKIDDFVAAAEKASLDDDTKDRLRAKIIELHGLSEASLQGAKSAVEKVREIIEAARNFQSYDEVGNRQETSIVANIPRRF